MIHQSQRISGQRSLPTRVRELSARNAEVSLSIRDELWLRSQHTRLAKSSRKVPVLGDAKLRTYEAEAASRGLQDTPIHALGILDNGPDM